MNNYYDLIKWAKAERLILKNKMNMVWGNGHYEKDPIKQAMYFGRLGALNDLLKYMQVNNMEVNNMEVNNMSENKINLKIKINDERNMQRALNSLNLFLENKEQYYHFKVVRSRTTLDLILVKYVEYPNCKGYVDRYIFSTETPLKMGAEITRIHVLLLNIIL